MSSQLCENLLHRFLRASAARMCIHTRDGVYTSRLMQNDEFIHVSFTARL
jgi:hypothetical protein